MSFFVHNACIHCLSKICPEKNISADEADVKQQEIKELVAIPLNFFIRNTIKIWNKVQGRCIVFK